MESTKKGKLIILSGPTASGKDAIMHRLLKLHPDFERIVTTTTRTSRDLERDGIDYYFISKDDFEKHNKEGAFLEINEYSGNFYGTPKSEFQKVLDGKTIIWRIDPTMAARAKEFFKSSFPPDQGAELAKRTIVIYLYSNPDVMKERLARRGMDPKDVQRRIEQDQQNWESCKDKFDQVIENEEGKLSETVEKIVSVIDSF